MKAICPFCGRFLRWCQPFDEPGVEYEACWVCRASVSVADTGCLPVLGMNDEPSSTGAADEP